MYSFSSLPRTCEKGKLGKLLPLRSFVLQEMLGRTGSFNHYSNSTLSIEGRRFVEAIPLLSMSSDHTYAHNVIKQHNALEFTHDDTMTLLLLTGRLRVNSGMSGISKCRCVEPLLSIFSVSTSLSRNNVLPHCSCHVYNISCSLLALE